MLSRKLTRQFADPAAISPPVVSGVPPGEPAEGRREGSTDVAAAGAAVGAASSSAGDFVAACPITEKERGLLTGDADGCRDVRLGVVH